MARSEPMLIVALGDSITAGYPLFFSPCEAPPDGRGDVRSQYAYWMMRKEPNWHVLNRGVTGQRSDEILARFHTDALAHRPQMMIALGGVNDLYQGRPPDWVTKHLSQLYERAAAAKIRVLACTILPFTGSTRAMQTRMAQVNEWIVAQGSRTTEQQDLVVCDLFQVMEDPRRPGELRDTDDGVHPNVDGHRRIAEALSEALTGWLTSGTRSHQVR